MKNFTIGIIIILFIIIIYFYYSNKNKKTNDNTFYSVLNSPQSVLIDKKSPIYDPPMPVSLVSKPSISASLVSKLPPPSILIDPTYIDSSYIDPSYINPYYYPDDDYFIYPPIGFNWGWNGGNNYYWNTYPGGVILGGGSRRGHRGGSSGRGHQSGKSRGRGGESRGRGGESRGRGGESRGRGGKSRGRGGESRGRGGESRGRGGHRGR